MNAREVRYERLRADAIRRYRAPSFVHHEWYVPYHLVIVERIASELLDRHPEADRDVTLISVWLHDIGKTTAATDVRAATRYVAQTIMRTHGFDEAFRAVVDENLRLVDRKRDLDTAPLEVQIVSTADGCSHLVGPFMSIWWRDNPQGSVEKLMAENRRKAITAWERKIVLPEARRAFEWRYRAFLEQVGDVPVQLLAPELGA